MTEDYNKKADRLHRTKTAIERQHSIAKAMGVQHKHNQPHCYAKMHSLNCGKPNCAMCGNPRKFYKDRTMQEKKFIEAHKGENS